VQQRWLGLACIVVGALAAGPGFLASWLVIKEPYTHVYWSSGEVIYAAGWFWLIALLLVAGIAFAMVAGARNVIVPRLTSLLLAVAAATSLAVMLVGVMTEDRAPVELYDGNIRNWTIPARFNAYPWITMIGLALIAAGSMWLWRVAVKLRRDEMAALAGGEA
jgi:hypothetical protein